MLLVQNCNGLRNFFGFFAFSRTEVGVAQQCNARNNFHFRNGVGDSGSGTYYLIEKYKTCYLNHTATIDIETDYIFTKNSSQYPYKKIYNCQFIDNSLIHYARGSNWCESDINYHTDKFNFMLNFLENNNEYTINLDDKVLYETAYTSKHYDGVGHNYKNYKFLNNDSSL